MLQGVAKVAGPVIGFTSDLSEGKSVGQAIAHTAVTTGLGIQIASGVGFWVTVALGVTPVGMVAVGIAVASGLVANIIYESNFLGIKDMANDWSKGFDNGIKGIKKEVGRVGESISKGWNSLVSSFGG
ncbi:hypothetical protein [Enterococcus rivorum]|nr:hypothetical protein [Enterococcus rivorum]